MPMYWLLAAWALVLPVGATVGPGLGQSCPHATPNAQGEYCYDTPSSQFSFDCANYPQNICSCTSGSAQGSLFLTYTQANCCLRCGCCTNVLPSPEPPSFPPILPSPPTHPPPALPHSLDDWWYLISESYLLPSGNMKPEGTTVVPGVKGYSAANEALAKQYCLTTAIDPATRDHAFKTNTYGINYYGGDGPYCGGLDTGQPYPYQQHSCSVQSTSNSWYCLHIEPGNRDGPNGRYMSGDPALAGTAAGVYDCHSTFDVGGWGNVNSDMPLCIWRPYDRGYTWWRFINSFDWQDAIAAGTRANPLTAPATPPVPPSPPPWPPGKAPTPPPAMPNNEYRAGSCFAMIEGALWSETEGEVDLGTTDVIAAKTACLANYYCTAVSTEYEGVTTFRMQFTCRAPQHLGCQTLKAGSNSYYRFDPASQIGAVCWDDAVRTALPPLTPTHSTQPELAMAC